MMIHAYYCSIYGLDVKSKFDHQTIDSVIFRPKQGFCLIVFKKDISNVRSVLEHNRGGKDENTGDTVKS